MAPAFRRHRVDPDLTPQQRKQLQTALSRMQRQQLQTKIRLT